MFADRPTEALEVLDGVRGELSTGMRRAKWHTARGLASFWGLSIEDLPADLTTLAAELDDPADRAWVNCYVAIQRLHLLDCDEAVRLARAVLDRPVAGSSPRVLALSTLAHLHALRGKTTQALQMSAQVESTATAWRLEMPHIQLALEVARGTALIIAGDVTGVDAIAAGDFAGMSDAGDFHLGSGHLSLILGQAARLRGRLGEAMRHQRQACAVLEKGRIYAAVANAERAHVAALAGDSDDAELSMAEADRLRISTMKVLYPWVEHARCWVRSSAGDVTGAVSQSLELADRLRSDGFHGHELLALHDVARMGQAELVTDRLAELVHEVETPIASIMADHARMAADRDPIGQLIAAEQF